MILIVLGVLMLIGLVILHELGHFWAARKAGVEVEEFGIGFPPKAKSLGEKNGTEFTLNWLPLGGFVKLKGEHDSDKTKGSFGAATLSDKVKIMLAGVVVNALTAVILLSIVAALGMPKFLDNQFTVDSDTTISQRDVVAVFVAEDSPAYNAGIRNGDVIRSVTELQSGKVYEIIEADDLGLVTEDLSGKEVKIVYENRGTEGGQAAQTNLRRNEEVQQSRTEREICVADSTDDGLDCPQAKGFLGVVPDEYIEQRSTWSAPIVGTVVSGQIVVETFNVLGDVVRDLFKGDTSTASEQVTGVVGLGYILGELSAEGFVAILFLVGVISISLAIMNILPIPALDGGRLFVTLLFRALNKPLTKDTEERIHGTGFMLLMLLFVLITVVDVQRFIL